jgi:glycosyltransferase involved in cell wall biosynthesis
MWLADALPEFDFDVVGTQERPSRPTPPNVRFHGFCERPEYEAILAASDVALGTLALHRKGMSEAAPLKVREYLLRGIPVIIGYTDPDLEDNPWFVLQLPNTEDNVRDAVSEIRDFVLSVAGRRVGREEVGSRIDALVKERERLDFLEDVAGAGFLPDEGATRESRRP